MTTTTTPTLKPLIDEPALVVENDHKALVIADLHLGIEAAFRQKGINIGSQTEKLLEHAITCVKAAEPDVIILLGDVKHAVPQILYSDRREVPFFLARLAEYAPVYIVKGNHDGYIDRILLEVAEPDWNPKHEIIVKTTKGFLFDNVGYTHGHSWPSQELFTAPHILIGHNHPRIRLVSSVSRHSSMKPVWIRVQCNPEAVKERYPKLKPELTKENAPWVTIMPAFNELCGGVAFNAVKGELLGPVASKLLRAETMEAYLLDGTYLGKVRDLKEEETSV
ncbi:MAG TPA: metallophosphoesterase [Desulfobacteria bacterium]|nr:metallophosphoesterase [Desulfobacteria bacterium]